MKRYIFILMGVLLPIFSIAQTAQAEKSNLIGKIIDQDGAALALATVSIINTTDSTAVKVGVTNSEGIFSFIINPGKYIARVNLLGYQSVKSQIFEIRSLTSAHAALSISLQKSVNTLKEVSIVSTRKAIEFSPGGYKFNVDKAIGATGNIFELLKQVPGVTIDGSGSIKLQGKGPTVMVNGRKVNMSGDDLAAYLKTISATQVAEIAVNTNPNAKFDADGEGGILDLKLKQRTTPGLFGQLSTNISTLVSTDNTASINFRKSKWDLSASYGYTYKTDYYRRDNSYENRNLPDSLFAFKQQQNADRTQKSSYLKSGASFQADSTSTITFNFFGAWFNLNSPTFLNSEIFNRTNAFQSKYVQTESNKTENNFYIYDLLYKKSFRNKDNLNLGINYSRYNNQSAQRFDRAFYDENNLPLFNQYEDKRLINTIRPYNLIVGNADYTANIGKTAKLDFGAKYTRNSTESSFNNSVYDSSNQTYVYDVSLSTQLNYKEDIVAAYTMLSGKIKSINYQLGIRYENFQYHLNSLSLASTYSNTYSNLFPSLNLSYATKDHKSNYSLNLGRRIQRPAYSMLNPFLNVVSLGQYNSGNPYLQPYFVNKAEFQFSRSYGNGNFLMASVFVSGSNNIFSQLFKYDPVTKMNFDTYDNFRSSTQYGGYVVLQNTITKWFNFNAYVAGTQSHFSTKIIGDVLYPGNFSLSGNLSFNFNLPKNIQFQVYGYGITKSNSFQLQNAANGNISMAAQRKFLKNRLTASVNFEDIFNISEYPVTANTATVYLHSLNKIQSQYVRLGFNYNFGKGFNSKSNKELKKESRTD